MYIVANLGRGSIGCRGQDNLEAEGLQPNSPQGEWLNDDDIYRRKSRRVVVAKGGMVRAKIEVVVLNGVLNFTNDVENAKTRP